MNDINEYISDITQRINGFLPTFINNVKYENYQELCSGFDNLSDTINRLLSPYRLARVINRKLFICFWEFMFKDTPSSVRTHAFHPAHFIY